MPPKANIFEFDDYRSFLEIRIKESPRGFKSKVSSAMRCQGTYFIRVLKGEAQLSDDQAFRATEFLQLSANEAEYFLDLVRYAKASDPKLLKYLKGILQKRSTEMREISKRVTAVAINASLETQIEYYSNWRPSVLHLATSCPQLRTDQDLSDRFDLDHVEVKKIMNFLVEAGLVRLVDGKYIFSGVSLHLPKGSAMQKVFQRERRSLITRSLEKPDEGALHFSSVFATSAAYQEKICSELLELIEKTHRELVHTESEDLCLLAIDFTTVV